MFGFLKKNDDLVGLNQKVGRLLNVFAKADMEDRTQRSESRMRLALPCLMFLASELKAPRSYAFGVTVDVSLHGMAAITSEELHEGDYVLVFGPKELRLYVLASCKRFLKSDFNSYTAAFTFKRAFEGKECQPFVSAIEIIEQSAATPIAPPISMPGHVGGTFTTV